MKISKEFLLVVVLCAAIPGLAASNTVTLTIPSMSCPVCPITVKKALQSVPGVSRVDVNFSKKEAVVVYDDAKVSVTALTKATANAGYPSMPKSQGK